MSKKLNYIIGTATILVIVGGTIYAVRKSIKAKLDGEEIITAEEAVRETESRRKQMEQAELSEEEMEEMIDGCRDEADWNASFLRVNTDEEEDEAELVSVGGVLMRRDELEEIEDGESEEVATDEGHGFYDNVDFDRPLAEYITEEDKVLKHEPNSMEARQQYMKMELAEWVPMEETYQTLLKLFNFPFVPQNDGDHILMTKIIDYRVQFFGYQSRWSKEVTFAEIILHFSKLLDYNCGHGIRYWVDYILQHNDLYHLGTSGQIEKVLDRLNAHTFYNEHTNTYGLFGLNEHYYQTAIDVAQRHIDQSLTYEIEFNELLKASL